MSGENLVPSASQTVGPFFRLGLRESKIIASSTARGHHLRLICRVFDGAGDPVSDAAIEIWQADADGRYRHPDDLQENTIAVDPSFRGFGRAFTQDDGSCEFETIKPGRVPAPSGSLQAPHFNVSVFARGVLKRLPTRIYFAGESTNAEDTILAMVPEDRRDTLMAKPSPHDPTIWYFEVHLCGERETVFFDL
ncbi:MAG TPA: protocatechuate 3,4-dioxygenase subunit alpha [Candidatus Angelobacter sp.]|nr:protocatechuate 3,4-dioxygenase subunit alpha [Candidatus Angelobacter sp.]